MFISLSLAGCKVKETPEEIATSETTAAETTITETTEAATKTPAEEKELSVLSYSQFVPAGEDYLKKVVDEWGAANGVKVKIDFVAANDMPSKITSEISVGSGHDITAIESYLSYIYEKGLADVGKYMDEVIAQSGEVSDLGKKISIVNGTWRSIPWYHQSTVIVYRKDLTKEVGYPVEKMNSLTLDDLMDLTKKLYEKGKGVVGFPVSSCGDANAIMASILWEFGGTLFDKNNKVAVYSPETKAALEYVAELGKYMPAEVTGWDNSGNNVFMLSGKGALSANPPSIYASAKKDNLEFASEIYHAPFPSGPGGSYRFTGVFSFGIVEHSKNKDLAAELIKYLLQKDIFMGHIDASQGYTAPLYADLTNVSTYWSDNPALSAIEPAKETLVPIGWPGPEATPTAASARVQLNYILPIMFSKVLSGDSTPEEAMTWTEGELNRFVLEGK